MLISTNLLIGMAAATFLVGAYLWARYSANKPSKKMLAKQVGMNQHHKT